MPRRRDLVLAAAGGVLPGGTARRALAEDGPVVTEDLGTLPGNKPLIRRSRRPPNHETPLALDCLAGSRAVKP